MGRSGDLVVVAYQLDPTKVVAFVPASAELPAERVGLLPDHRVLYEDGRDAKPLRQLVEDFLKSEEVWTRLAYEAKEHHRTFVVLKSEFLDLDGSEIFLEKLQPRVLRRIESLYVEGGCRFEYSKSPLRHANLGDVKVSWGQGHIAGRDALVVASPDQAGEAKLTITFSANRRPEDLSNDGTLPN